jgi:quercetin dioxygenase-like cupin family protein
MSPRFGVVVALVLVGSICIVAQQANFTGKVQSLDAMDVRAVRFQYEAGARSYWHAHDGAQTLILEKGRGRVQEQGKPVREMLPGQPVFLAAGVPHWHGAAPNEGLVQIAVNVGGVKWMQAVTDQEYLASPAR